MYLYATQARFAVPVPHNVTAAEAQLFSDHMVRPIRLRVVNVLKHWIERHYHDFNADERLQVG